MTVIATWNVNSIRTRSDHLTTWLKDRQPDIVLLQELKCVDEAFPYDLVHDAGYNVEVFGQKTYNGVAILSKTPIEDVVRGLPTLKDEQSRYIQALCGDTLVASVYVPNGQDVGSDKFGYKLTFYDALKQHTRDLLKTYDYIVIGGDYNVAPSRHDGHDPDVFMQNRILCSLQERHALNSFVNEGLVDGYRVLYPESIDRFKNQFSWWDYRAGSYENNKGYRIDHLYCSPKQADRLNAAGIDHETRGYERPSDHAPVWIGVTRAP